MTVGRLCPSEDSPVTGDYSIQLAGTRLGKRGVCSTALPPSIEDLSALLLYFAYLQL